jgi:dihydropyrimidinase
VTAEEGRGRFVERPPNQAVHQSLSSWKALSTPKAVERAAIPAGV